MNKKQKLLDKFGKIYINFIRDNVLEGMEQIINNEYKGYYSQKLQKRIANLMPDQLNLLKFVIASAVDKSLHYTLFMLQEHEQDMQLNMYDEDDHEYSLVEISDGLCGELYSEDGWIAKYSKYPSWTEDIEETKED
ncbi:hypothetical protein A3306_01825 [Rickettsia bellii]|uniref:Uncharacterized protein n=1 Tax=Rickettsia bellii str. RML An4 TaxID=1359193 RepID=A0A0F3QGJ2_RICBE|nr:hypothetical protein [Rickettsia bellii]ARD85999.1 hypothetical protein A3306_01825 [Rickettsia bellii]KJV90544.1 hypothetical protein RBEAN4_1550 [Rickettsia bellii str. RML An4]